LEGPALLDVEGGTVTASLGSAIEFVVHRTNHWRWNLGIGTVLRVPLSPATPVSVGPLAETALRWLFVWGTGLSLSVHALAPIVVVHEPSPQVIVIPTLALYTEL
jgi:hypothetical protein